MVKALFLWLFCFSYFGVVAQKDLSSTFRNPVLGGDYPDPSILRDGDDYYMVHSSFEYYPGLLIWHSTDLIHWQRVCHALHKYVGSVWAPDFVKYGKTYYIYFLPVEPIGLLQLLPAGPWSDPIDLKLHGFIDPGHGLMKMVIVIFICRVDILFDLRKMDYPQLDNPNIYIRVGSFLKIGAQNVFV